MAHRIFFQWNRIPVLFRLPKYDTSGAIEYYDKALAIDPKYANALLMPIFAGICMYVYGYFLFNPSIIYHNSNYIPFIKRAAQPCYLIVIVYALYPIVFTAETFSKNNYENIANEFEFTKKSLFVGLPILVILITVSELLRYFKINSYLLS